MKKVFSSVIVLFVILMFSGCTKPLVQYTPEKKVLSLKISEEKRLEVQFDKPYYKTWGGYCLTKAYILTDPKVEKYGYLYIKHTTLEGRCSWNGLAEDYFLELAKKIWKATNVKKFETIKKDPYQFTRYSADVKGKSMTVYIIEIWGGKENTFIVDPKGTLTKELKSELNVDS